TQDELSRRESLAFNEIGRTLRDDGVPANDVDTTTTGKGGAAGGSEAGRTPESTPEAGQPSRDAGHTARIAANDGGGDPDRGKTREADPLRGGTNSILEQLPVPVLIYRNGVTLYANPELLDLTGYGSVEELSSAGGVDVLLSGDPEQGHATLICKDGRGIGISPLLQTVPWNDEGGSAGKALLLSFRPTPAGGGDLPPDEKIALDVARVAELQNILDTATDGILIAGRDGGIESINASAEALFGLDLDQAVGRPLTELFAQESRQTLTDYMAELAQPGVASILNDGREVIGKEAKGGLIPLFITIGPVGAAEKFCVVLRDMTHWKKAEEELVNARRAAESASEQKTDFLARVSHEIRTPLNAIIGFSDVMLEERFGPIGNERYREYLRDINRSGVHVLDLINDLLDISKIEAGKMELTYEAVDLNQIVAETVALLQPQANRERIIIRTSLSRAVPRVVADARSIRQIILNLVSNAIKFTPENGQVIVSTVYEGNGEVALRVRDTGNGMSAADIDNAMKPFQQLRGVDEKRGQGTGLGLPLTKALVEANRAYFDLESTPGEGTIAHVHFPTQRVLAD
ncbi:MAG: PAS domain-containing sensor histidine kinase, partial [Pseudomonadota bacterium]|nr:PAS domain-containing sensor histidine kinase [Pseudomonadota bacterium]